MTVSVLTCLKTWCTYTELAFLGMSHLSSSLRSESEKYRKAARNINFNAMLRQYAPIGAILFIIIILIWWRFT